MKIVEKKKKNVVTPFVKGHPPYKKKGAIHKKTQLWNQFGEYVVSHGVVKAMTIMQKELDNEQYMTWFFGILEYFKPKLSRSETTIQDGQTIEIKPIEWVQ